MLEFAGILAFLLGFLFSFIAGYAMLKGLEEMAECAKWMAIFSISLKLGG